MRSALIIIFVSISASVLALMGKEYNPEKDFLGNWQEVAWDYKEAKNSVVLNLGLLKVPADENRDSIRIHAANRWHFEPGGVLKLREENEEKILTWRLKGRGHILEITDGDVTEYYDINLLSNNKIELNFISPSFVKESAKLVIERS